jgi:catechol 2,3-dioxygenase-like lactoylglutathione lyase family enzyme
MPKVSGLGHVGLWAKDPARMAQFYREVLGLQLTDTNEHPPRQLMYLSAKPETEHHHVLLIGPPPDDRQLQHISFYVDSLAELRAFYQEFQARQVPIDVVLSHGNAIGIYFTDPDGNRCEVYWRTGREAHPPYSKPIDLALGDEELLAQL